MPTTTSLLAFVAQRLRVAASFNSPKTSALDHNNENGLKGDSRRQQFGLQFLGSARSKMAAQERLYLARLYIEKISQDLALYPCRVSLGSSPLISLASTFSIISVPTGFWPTL